MIHFNNRLFGLLRSSNIELRNQKLGWDTEEVQGQ